MTVQDGRMFRCFGGLGVMWCSSKLYIEVVRQERAWQRLQMETEKLHFQFPIINMYGPNN